MKTATVIEPFDSPALSEILQNAAQSGFDLIFLDDLMKGLVYGANRYICQQLVTRLPVLVGTKAFGEVYAALDTLWCEGMKGLEVYEDRSKGFGLRIQNMQ